MELLKSLQVSASGMSTERARLEIVSANIANANSTRSAEGGPYKRRLPIIESISFDRMFLGALSRYEHEEPLVPHLSEVITDPNEGPTVYDPGHPDADAQGYVKMPNVNLVTEMVDMMVASRSYEANLNAIDAAKDMALKALDISRG